MITCAAALAAQGWKVIESPNGGTQAGGNVLFATVALSPTDAWAVGAEPNPSQYLTSTLAEHWNGVQWSIIPTPPISAPTVQLNSIAALNSSDVWAAGYSDNPSCLCGQTVVERWNGSSWTRLASPNPGVADYLTGIAATSASDVWAAGYEWTSRTNFVPLLLHYNGSSWSPSNLSRLQFGQLFSVFAVATNDVWAVGWIGAIPNTGGLVLHWNGTTWTRVQFPTESGGWIALKSISGVAANDIWAVGSYNFFNITGGQASSARSYHWDGSRWSSVTVGLGGYSYLASVAAGATDDVWAAGEGTVGSSLNESYVTLHWKAAAGTTSRIPIKVS